MLLAILQGDHVNHPAVEYIQTDYLKIENLSEQDISVDYDGEQLPGGFPLEIEIIPEGIPIIIPAKEKK